MLVNNRASPFHRSGQVVLLGALLFLVAGTHLLFAAPGLPRIPEWTHAYAAEHGPELTARAAVLLDAQTGTVLYEREGDTVIPPASLTKLVAMYAAFEMIAEGRIALDDVVALPPETWARNTPVGSSLMFLGPDQRVTVRELLLGLAVSSGNDAAVALALHASGSVPAFVDEMNRVVADLDLPSLHFEEPSGLSAENQVTAREFAWFVRAYLERHPHAASEYHSIPEFTFPHSASYPDGRINVGAITQFNRNSLLRTYTGADGLKTGFIRQSSYNLAATAARDGRRLIVVILGAPGENHLQGERNRSADATGLFDFGFDRFQAVRLHVPVADPVRVWGGRVRTVVPGAVVPEYITVARSHVQELAGVIVQDFEIEAPVKAGQVVGRVQISSGESMLMELPLTVAEAVDRAGWIRVAWDRMVRFVVQLIGRR